MAHQNWIIIGWDNTAWLESLYCTQPTSTVTRSQPRETLGCGVPIRICYHQMCSKYVILLCQHQPKCHRKLGLARKRALLNPSIWCWLIRSPNYYIHATVLQSPTGIQAHILFLGGIWGSRYKLNFTKYFVFLYFVYGIIITIKTYKHWHIRNSKCLKIFISVLLSC